MPRPCPVCKEERIKCSCLTRCDGCKFVKSSCICHKINKPQKPKRKWF